MGSIYIMAVFALAGGLLICFLWGISADMASSHNEKAEAKGCCAAGGLIAVLALATIVICLVHKTNHPTQMYEYTVRAYYLDGGSRILKVESDDKGPEIGSYKGSYWLDTRYGYVVEKGVVRFDVISKHKITEGVKP